MDKAEVISSVKSCLVTRKGDSTTNDLYRDFRDFVGSNIPYKSLGFHNLEEFLRSIPEITLKKCPVTGVTLLSVTDEKLDHIKAMVDQQKSNAKKNKKGFQKANYRTYNGQGKQTKFIGNSHPRTSQQPYNNSSRSDHNQQSKYNTSDSKGHEYSHSKSLVLNQYGEPRQHCNAVDKRFSTDGKINSQAQSNEKSNDTIPNKHNDKSNNTIPNKHKDKSNDAIPNKYNDHKFKSHSVDREASDSANTNDKFKVTYPSGKGVKSSIINVLPQCEGKRNNDADEKSYEPKIPCVKSKFTLEGEDSAKMLPPHNYGSLSDVETTYFTKNKNLDGKQSRIIHHIKLPTTTMQYREGNTATSSLSNGSKKSNLLESTQYSRAKSKKLNEETCEDTNTYLKQEYESQILCRPNLECQAESITQESNISQQMRKLNFESSSNCYVEDNNPSLCKGNEYTLNNLLTKNCMERVTKIVNNSLVVTVKNDLYWNNDKNVEEMYSPVLLGHQLIGGDFLLYLANIILDCDVFKNDPRCGLCISGNSISECLKEVRRTGCISSRVMLLIGAVDILEDTPMAEMVGTMQILLEEISRKTESFVLLTIPPLLLQARIDKVWQKQIDFNNWIKMQDGVLGIQVVDIWPLFVEKNTNIYENLFEMSIQTMDGSDDVVLWNEEGIMRVVNELQMYGIK